MFVETENRYVDSVLMYFTLETFNLSNGKMSKDLSFTGKTNIFKYTNGGRQTVRGVFRYLPFAVYRKRPTCITRLITERKQAIVTFQMDVYKMTSYKALQKSASRWCPQTLNTIHFAFSFKAITKHGSHNCCVTSFNVCSFFEQIVLFRHFAFILHQA